MSTPVFTANHLHPLRQALTEALGVEALFANRMTFLTEYGWGIRSISDLLPLLLAPGGTDVWAEVERLLNEYHGWSWDEVAALAEGVLYPDPEELPEQQLPALSPLAQATAQVWEAR